MGGAVVHFARQAALFGDVMEHEHGAQDLAGHVADGGAGILDPAFRAVAADE